MVAEPLQESLYRSPSQLPTNATPLLLVSPTQDGVGIRKYANGNLYEGSFSEGEVDGEGTMRYASG